MENEENLNNNNTGELGQTFPLYDEVKRNIYKNFEEVKNISASLFNSRNIADYNLNRRIFQERFISMYLELKHDNKLKKIENRDRIYIDCAYKSVVNKKLLTNTNIIKVIDILRKLIEALGITNIEARKKDTWAI